MVTDLNWRSYQLWKVSEYQKYNKLSENENSIQNFGYEISGEDTTWRK
jgi:hypothetical protein